MKLDGKALAAAMLAKSKDSDEDRMEDLTEESMEMDLMKDMMMAIKEERAEVLYSALCRMIDMHLNHPKEKKED
jgi:hypothetical protein